MGKGPKRRLALAKYRVFAPVYGWTVPYRRYLRRAIALLDLKPGEVVLDVGCGTGVAFSRILETIGSEGRLVGIDQSPDMLREARQRAERNGWTNVTLITSPVEDADIPVQADAALFSFVHDLMRTPAALENVVRHLSPAAASSRWGQEGTLVGPATERRSIGVHGHGTGHDHLRGVWSAMESPRAAGSRSSRRAGGVRALLLCVRDGCPH